MVSRQVARGGGAGAAHAAKQEQRHLSPSPRCHHRPRSALVPTAKPNALGRRTDGAMPSCSPSFARYEDVPPPSCALEVGEHSEEPGTALVTTYTVSLCRSACSLAVQNRTPLRDTKTSFWSEVRDLAISSQGGNPPPEGKSAPPKGESPGGRASPASVHAVNSQSAGRMTYVRSSSQLSSESTQKTAAVAAAQKMTQKSRKGAAVEVKSRGTR